MTRQSTIRQKPSSRPGTTPAMNRVMIEIEPPVASEKITALWLGGTSSACTEAVIVTLVANTRGKPAFSICGIITEPMAEVSATAEPEIPLRKVVANTLTTDNPPRTRVNPTSTSAKD